MSIQPDDVEFVITKRDDDILEIWRREGTSAEEFAAELREIADALEDGNLRRIK